MAELVTVAVKAHGCWVFCYNAVGPLDQGCQFQCLHFEGLGRHHSAELLSSTSQDLHVLAVHCREGGMQPEMGGGDGVNVAITRMLRRAKAGWDGKTMHLRSRVE